MATRRSIAAAALLWMGSAFGQDAQFTQFYAQPTYLSPAFAGTSLQSRFGLTCRDQWPSIPGAFMTYNAAWDHYMSSVNSGVGILVTHDRAGSGALRYTNIAAQYAYEIELKRKVFIRPALQFGYVQHAVDISKLTFGDQLARGGDLSSYEQSNARSVHYADVAAGVLFFTPKLWLGMGLHHLNEPNQSLLENNSRVPRKFSLHGGYRYRLRSPVIKKHPESIVAAFNFKSQGKYDQLDVGAYYEREPIYTGLWYRGIPMFKSYGAGEPNNDALAVLFGVMINDLRIGYSYDLTVSRLSARSGGAHELTLTYELADRRRKRAMAKRRVVPCAKF